MSFYQIKLRLFLLLQSGNGPPATYDCNMNDTIAFYTIHYSLCNYIVHSQSNQKKKQNIQNNKKYVIQEQRQQQQQKIGTILAAPSKSKKCLYLYAYVDIVRYSHYLHGLPITGRLMNKQSFCLYTILFLLLLLLLHPSCIWNGM